MLGQSETNPNPEVRLIPVHHARVEVDLEGRDGKLHRYVVCELDDDGLAQWLQSMDDRLIVDEKTGKITGQNYKGMHAELISLTLREKEGDRRVTLSEAEGYGPAAKAELFNIAKEVNGFSEKVVSREKKESPSSEGSTPGSESPTASSSAASPTQEGTSAP